MFTKYLSQAMIDALNKEYKNGGWWRALADHEDTFIAIRDGYLNVYRNGCSIAMVDYYEQSDELRAGIHYKYLLKKNIEDPYIIITALMAYRTSRLTRTSLYHR